jgi:hypothetical protein
VEQYTLVFNAFVLMQLFNQVNSRKVHDEPDVLAGLAQQRLFLGILGLEAALQVAIVQCGGRAFSTVPLNAQQWAVCVGCGGLTLLLRQALRLVPTEPPSSGGGGGGGGGSPQQQQQQQQEEEQQQQQQPAWQRKAGSAVATTAGLAMRPLLRVLERTRGLLAPAAAGAGAAAGSARSRRSSGGSSSSSSSSSMAAPAARAADGGSSR